MNINKNNTDEVISSHKKRGRKPKAQIVDPIMEPVEVIKKKRGRKPKGKIINYAKELVKILTQYKFLCFNKNMTK